MQKKFAWSIFIILLTACASGQVHLENDYGAFFNKNNDKYFTHGSKFSSYNLADSGTSLQTYSLGQNIYTPSAKCAEALPSELRNNRPYTGFLYGEYRKATVEDSTKTIYGVAAGCSGRCSYAKETQRTIHTLLGQGYPTWDREYSLKSEPGLILELEKYYAITEPDTDIYSNFYVLSKFGNIVTSGSVGFNFAYGEGVDHFAPEPITFKSPRETEDFMYYIFGNIEGRAVPYNRFLEGSIFQDERHTVNAEPIVGEANLGFRIGYKNLKFSYNYTVVSEEWEGQNGAFFFGGLDLSW